MAAYVKFDGIDGASTDENHPKWTLVEAISFPISRSIPSGAKDFQRARGETSLGDIVLVRELDKASVKLAEACATGKFFKSVEIHMTTDVKGKNEPYLTIKLSDVIISSYSFHGVSSGNPLPSEELSLNYSEIEWTYSVINPKTGDVDGQVPAKYSPGQNKAG